MRRRCDSRADRAASWPITKPPGAEGAFRVRARAAYWRLLDRVFATGVEMHLLLLASPLSATATLARKARRGHERHVARPIAGTTSRCSHASQERRHIRLAVRLVADTTGDGRSSGTALWGPACTARLVVEEGGFLFDSIAYNDDLPYLDMRRKNHLVIPYSSLDQ